MLKSFHDWKASTLKLIDKTLGNTFKFHSILMIIYYTHFLSFMELFYSNCKINFLLHYFR